MLILLELLLTLPHCNSYKANLSLSLLTQGNTDWKGLNQYPPAFVSQGLC